MNFTYKTTNRIIMNEKAIATDLIQKFIEKKAILKYANLSEDNIYSGWVSNFQLKLSDGNLMSLDLKEEKDLFLLFVLAITWSRTGPWENAAFFTTYLKHNKKDNFEYWIKKENIRSEVFNREISANSIFKIVSGIIPRRKISFRDDIFESIYILSNKWNKIKNELSTSSLTGNYKTFINFMRNIDGLAGPSKKISIKIPLILRELRCQNIYNNIPGEFCCVADARVVKAAKDLGIRLPTVTRTTNNLINVSTIIYELFGDLYDLPLFAYEDL